MLLLRSIFSGIILSGMLLPTGNRGLAHDIDEVRLPPYELGQQRGYATLRITHVEGSYIVAFATSQFNIMHTENPDIRDPLLILQRDSLLSDLKNPEILFNASEFDCRSVMKPNALAQTRLRQLNEDMSFKYVMHEQQSQYTERFSHITVQYKLACQEPIELSRLKFAVFELAPKLDTLLLRLVSAAGDVTQKEIERSVTDI